MMRKRICFPFVGNLVGGSHISSAALIRHLDPARFDAVVVLQHAKGVIAELMHSEGISFEEAPPTGELEHGRHLRAGSVASLLAAAPRLIRFLRERHVDIVHCNDGRTLATWALATKMTGAKLVWHHRGSPDAIGLRLVAPVLADRVIAVSHFAAPRAGFYSAAARTHVIHSPFDTTTVHNRHAAREALLGLLPNASAATRIVTFSGTLIDRKRPLLFVDAIAALRRHSPDIDVRGVILGESFDGMNGRIEDLAIRRDVHDAIHILGYRTPGSFWLAGSDLLLVPAIGEPFGRTLIEAMLVGTPVVAAESGGNIEAIRDGQTGLLATPENAEALAKACLSLLMNRRQWAAIAATARRDALSRFGEAKHAEAVMAVYSDMLGTPTRARLDMQELPAE